MTNVCRPSFPTETRPPGSRSWDRRTVTGLPRAMRTGSSPPRTTRIISSTYSAIRPWRTSRRRWRPELVSVEHVKRATYIGTAIDQGRTSGVLTAAIVNQLLGAGPDAQGPTNARPPSVPISYATIAGPDRGELMDPVRRTRIHLWHEEQGAVFEDVGQWKRPRYFPGDGEEMDAAVARECLAVRNAAGVLDASTLGKIEVLGPDAAVLPGPDVHEPDEHAAGGIDPLRVHARPGRDGRRRRRGDSPRRGPLPRDDHHRECRDGARPLRGMAADRMAGPARVLHERDRAVDRRGGRRPEGARGARRGSARTSTSHPRRSRS